MPCHCAIWYYLVVGWSWTHHATLGLTFGPNTLVTQAAAFHRPNETLEVLCVAPAQMWYKSSTMYFTLASHVYGAANSDSVSIINSTAIKLTWNFKHDVTDEKFALFCFAPSEQPGLHTLWHDPNSKFVNVNYGLSSTRQTLRCYTQLSSVSTMSGTASVKCTLTIVPHSHYAHYFKYTVYMGTNEVEQEEFICFNDSLPRKANFSFVRNATIIFGRTHWFFKTVLLETQSYRTFTMIERMSIVDTIVLPKDAIAWKSFTNGTGLTFSLNASFLAQKCEAWTYYANLTVSSTRTALQTPLEMKCNVCDLCTAEVKNLSPSTPYSISLQQKVFDNESRSTEWLSAAELLYVHTDEQVPSCGPEIEQFYWTSACKNVQTCSHIANRKKCQVVKIFWKTLPKHLLNGNLMAYRVEVNHNNTWMDTFNVSAEVRSAVLCRQSDKQTTVFVAAATSRGFPSRAKWSNCTIPRDSSQKGLMPQAVTLWQTTLSNGRCMLSLLLPKKLEFEPERVRVSTFRCNGTLAACSDYRITALNQSELLSNPWPHTLTKFSWHEYVSDVGNTDVVALALYDSRDFATGMMIQLAEIDCWWTTTQLESDAAPQIALTSSEVQGLCIQWLLSTTVGCNAQQGFIIIVEVSLWEAEGESIENGMTVVLPATETSYCFKNLKEAEVYSANVSLIIDNGGLQPLIKSSAIMSQKTRGFTYSEKTGITLGAILLLLLALAGVVGCIRKVHYYNRTWRDNLEIPKIKLIPDADKAHGLAWLEAEPGLRRKLILYQDCSKKHHLALQRPREDFCSEMATSASTGAMNTSSLLDGNYSSRSEGRTYLTLSTDDLSAYRQHNQCSLDDIRSLYSSQKLKNSTCANFSKWIQTKPTSGATLPDVVTAVHHRSCESITDSAMTTSGFESLQPESTDAYFMEVLNCRDAMQRHSEETTLTADATSATYTKMVTTIELAAQMLQPLVTGTSPMPKSLLHRQLGALHIAAGEHFDKALPPKGMTKPWKDAPCPVKNDLSLKVDNKTSNAFEATHEEKRQASSHGTQPTGYVTISSIENAAHAI